MTVTLEFDVAALRQAANMEFPSGQRDQWRLWNQNATDLSAAADYIDELGVRLELALAAMTPDILGLYEDALARRNDDD